MNNSQENFEHISILLKPYFLLFIDWFIVFCIFIFLFTLLYLNCLFILQLFFSDFILLFSFDFCCINYLNDHLDESNNTFQNTASIDDSKFNNIHNIINKIRCRFYWELIEVDKNNYTSYNKFKNNFNPDVNIRKEIINELKVDIHKIKLHKRTLSWFLNIRKHN
jgi:hypothetical protein